MSEGVDERPEERSDEDRTGPEVIIRLQLPNGEIQLDRNDVQLLEALMRAGSWDGAWRLLGRPRAGAREQKLRRLNRAVGLWKRTRPFEFTDKARRLVTLWWELEKAAERLERELLADNDERGVPAECLARGGRSRS